MQKLVKSIKFASAYAAWEASSDSHIEYDKSKTYYEDVRQELIRIQNGLCAYTEQRLADENQVNLANNPLSWTAKKEGEGLRFGLKIEGKDLPGGALDHFDNALKNTKGWQWDNFFLVESEVNSKVKGTKTPNSILKPDAPNYDPMLLLDYNFDLHIFIANIHRSEKEKALIRDTIEILGLNWKPIVAKRKAKFSSILRLWRSDSCEEFRAELLQGEFITAGQMIFAKKMAESSSPAPEEGNWLTDLQNL